ncbi:Uncharacterized protein Adt_39895 [Abeliophyllum distichum]|uniref:Retrotransposon gag domain-containing protein n=1 Tax=Abeliophyllum distichum TaxID=126358 RepID=A0ABD1Q9J6_9LAMI
MRAKDKKYDRSTKLNDYLRTFVDFVRLQVSIDSVMYRAFLPTLMRKARNWVANLSPKSICTFDDFYKKFATYFAINKATLKIKDLQMSTVVTDIMNGTRSHSFKMLLSKNPFDMMHELVRRGYKYVDADEAFFITEGIKDRKEPKSNKRKTQDKPKPKPRDDKGKHEAIF